MFGADCFSSRTAGCPCICSVSWSPFAVIVAVRRDPSGQVTRDVSTESSSVTWMPSLDAVAAVEREEMFMLPPTYLTCLEIGQHEDPAAVMEIASARSVEMFMPEVVDDGGEFILSRPPHYDELLAGRGLR